MKKSIILLLALSACTGHALARPGATQADFEADRQACMYEVNKASASNPVDNALIAGVQQARVFNSCMAVKGWK